MANVPFVKTEKIANKILSKTNIVLQFTPLRHLDNNTVVNMNLKKTYFSWDPHHQLKYGTADCVSKLKAYTGRKLVCGWMSQYQQ